LNSVAIALAGMAGGLLCLERKTWGQLMLSRPIVVAPIVAAILGNARAGFALGIPIELAFLGTASYGTSTPPHETLAALFSAALAASCVEGGALGREGVFGLAFFAGLPFALIGRAIEARIERHNVIFVDEAEAILARGRTARATRNAFVSVMGILLTGVAVTLLGVLVGVGLSVWPATVPRCLYRTFTYAWPLATGTSAALAIRTIKIPYGALLAATTAFAVLALGFGVLWFSR